MSLAIDPETITAVLLADGWHDVAHDTFDLDAYEYLRPHPDPNRDPLVLLYGGRVTGVPSTGFVFTDDTGHAIYGPLTSILAVRTSAPE